MAHVVVRFTRRVTALWSNGVDDSDSLSDFRHASRASLFVGRETRMAQTERQADVVKPTEHC